MSKEFKALFMTLKEQQKDFWLHYWQSNCKSLTASAKAAGYAECSSNLTGSALKNGDTGRRLMGFYLDEIGSTRESLLADLHAINNASMEDFKCLMGKDIIAELEAAGADLKQVKKLTVSRKIVGTGDDKYEVEGVVVELYDRLKAIDTQAKIRQLYSETTTNINITYEQALAKLEDAKDGLKTDPDHVRGVLEARSGS